MGGRQYPRSRFPLLGQLPPLYLLDLCLSVIDCNRLALVIQLRLAEPQQLSREITVTDVAGCTRGFDGGEGSLHLFDIACLRPLLKRGGLRAQRLGGGVESVAIGLASRRFNEIGSPVSSQ